VGGTDALLRSWANPTFLRPDHGGRSCARCDDARGL